MIRVLAPLPVLLPLLGAAVALLLGRRPELGRALSIGVLTAVLGVVVALLFLVDESGVTAVSVGDWPVPLGIPLVVDRLSAVMLLVAATVTLAVLVYAVGQGTADSRVGSTPVSIFYPTYLVLVAGVSNAFLTGDLFNLYVSFEVLLAASFVLLTLGGSGARIRAGITYVVVSLLGSLLFLAGIALTYAATGTLSMAQLAVRLDDVPDGTRTVLHLVLLTSFGIKAAVFPLSAWLPDSYPSAPAPVTAVFAGLLTKVGIYAIIRTNTLLFPQDTLDDLLLVAAIATMLVGILGALAQTDIKRVLCFTLLSHIGYMIFGIGLDSRVGLSAAIVYVVHHIVVQTALFLTAGLLERRAGSTAVDRLGGLATASPLLAVLFFVPALSLAGIPPLSGFLGKLGLLQAGVVDGGALAWALVAAGSLTSLLTLYAVAKVWAAAFWRPRQHAPDQTMPDQSLLGQVVAEQTGGDWTLPVETGPGRTGAGPPGRARPTGRGGITVGAARVAPRAAAPSGATAAVLVRPEEGDPRGSVAPPLMVGATVAMIGVMLAITAAAGPLVEVTDRAAEDLRERTPYIRSVLPEDARVPEATP